jgi:LVIVD repeat
MFKSTPSNVFSLRRVFRATLIAAAVVVTLGCSEQIVQTQAPIGGSCLTCHEGITDVHPFFALACVDCHGGNDQVAMPATVNVRDQGLLKLSHVLPLDSTMWWPNGVDDDGNGQVDEQGEFFDGRAVTAVDVPFADKRVAKKDQMDSEMNRDLNYLRFINPSDLRVANASCGAKNKNANSAMVCHAEIVYDVRRSIMTSHSGVPAGATYGNAQLVKAADYGDDFVAAFGAEFDARNSRIGRVGYTFDYDSIDANFNPELKDDKRNLVTGGFDHDALLDAADRTQDPEDDKFEAQAGPVFDDGRPELPSSRWDPGQGLTRTGQALKFFSPGNPNNRAVPVLQSIGNAANRTWPIQGSALELRIQMIIEGAAGLARTSPIQNLFDQEAITNPVDAALRDFRAYHSLNFWAPMDNFGQVNFTTSPNADDPPPPSISDVELRNQNNPFGRGRPSGCASCHIEYRKDGKNLEENDRTVADNGRNPSLDLPFGIRTDLGQRFYPKKHELKRAVGTETCGSCHGFVTRVDYALNGVFEHESDLTNQEQVTTVASVFSTPGNKSTVNLFDNLAHYKNGVLLNTGEQVTEDINNNGELDTGLVEKDINGDGFVQPNEDFNKNGLLDGPEVIINEDKNNNGLLDIPDRVARSESFDGRQSRIVYGAANGSTHLIDVHAERGMQCTDCHIGGDVHGDGNLYARNWDSVQIECDDCHGTNDAAATLVFSGPNGGDDMNSPRYTTASGKPWFERDGETLIQNSRVFANLKWKVPQLSTPRTDASAYAHKQPNISPPEKTNEICAGFTDEDSCTNVECSWDGSACKGFDRKYAHIAEPTEKGGLECYACHSSWQPNCLSCHLKMDIQKEKQEIWFGDDDVEDIFFQLFSYTRSPFYLGHTGNVEGNKIAPHRSTMQVHLTVVAGAAGVQAAESAVFSTANNLSSMASNPYFPHTVRTLETKSCARCHTLKDPAGNVANDHMITEASAQGTGRYQNVGDWLVTGTAAGLDLLEIKKNNGGKITFPGFVLADAADEGAAAVGRVNIPLVNTTEVFDVALNRGVSAVNGSGDIFDIAIVGHSTGVTVVDIFGRDNVGYPPTELARLDSIGLVRSVDVVDSAASQTTRFIAASDDELVVVDYRAALPIEVSGRFIDIKDAGTGDDLINIGDFDGVDDFTQGMTIVGRLPHGKRNPTKVRLVGDKVILSHAGGVTLYQLGEAGTPITVDIGVPTAEIANFETLRPALDVVTSGRFAYVATGSGGVEVFDIGPFTSTGFFEASPKRTRIGSALTTEQEAPDSRAVAMYGSKLIVADGKNGLRVVDISTPAKPVLERTIINLDNGQRLDNASVVVMASEPARHFALVGSGAAVHAVNLTDAVDFRTKLAAAAATPELLNGFRLSPERSDPLTPFDIKNAVLQTFTFPAGGNVRAIARGIPFDNLADKSGRRLRDNWSIGSRPLNDATVARMRSVVVKEIPGTKDVRGDGLGCVVLESDNATQEGEACRPSPTP